MIYRMRGFSVMVTAFLGAAAFAAQDDANEKALKQLQGSWEVNVDFVEGQDNGKQRRERGGKMYLIIHGNKSIMSSGPDVDVEVFKEKGGTFTIDGTKSPKFIDFAAVPSIKAKFGPGIYELDGDELKICKAKFGQERPKDFTSTEKNMQTILFAKRVKK